MVSDVSTCTPYNTARAYLVPGMPLRVAGNLKPGTYAVVIYLALDKPAAGAAPRTPALTYRQRIPCKIEEFRAFDKTQPISCDAANVVAGKPQSDATDSNRQKPASGTKTELPGQPDNRRRRLNALTQFEDPAVASTDIELDGSDSDFEVRRCRLTSG